MQEGLILSDEKETPTVSLEFLLARTRAMTGQELRTLGISEVAYCRSVIQDGALRVAIHAADGTPMAIMEDEASALQAMVDNELTPALLH